MYEARVFIQQSCVSHEQLPLLLLDYGPDAIVTVAGLSVFIMQVLWSGVNPSVW